MSKAPGITYTLTPLAVTPEMCDIESIYRMDGGFNLDITNLTLGAKIPPLAPLSVNTTTHKAITVKNVKVYENAAANATAIKVSKKSLAYLGMFIGNGTKSAEVTAIATTNAAYDLLTITLGAAVTAGQVLMQTAAPASPVAAVKGVYTATIGTVPAVDDVWTLNGIAYTFAAAAAEGKIMIGADKVATALNLQDVVEADNQNFVVKANGAKLVFTQKVAGVGAIPTSAVTQTGGGTLVASIAETTAGVVAVSGDVSVPLNVANYLNYSELTVALGETGTMIGKVYQIKESKLQVPVSAADKASLGSNFMFV